MEERLLDNHQAWQISFGETLGGSKAVGGYLTGRSTVTDVDAHQYAPGTIAEHLTSFGGFIGDATTSQMSILAWLEAGADGSYGTVVEPCNFTNKFPHTRVQYWNTRGYSFAESFAMAVEADYQGVAVGDPLSRPHASFATIDVAGVTNQQGLTGAVPIQVQVDAHSPEHPIDRVDFYVDGVWLQTLTNVPPATGDVLSVTINGRTKSYAVQPGDDLEDVRVGLLEKMNEAGPPPTRLRVTAAGVADRIEFYHDTIQAGESGTGISVSAGVFLRLPMGTSYELRVTVANCD